MFGLKMGNQQQDGENCIQMIFVIFTFHQELFWH